VHGFDRIFRAAMAQLHLTSTAALRARRAPLRTRHIALKFQG
jgi:hypothetical protein